jgi:putative acetyltransferase
MNTDERIDERIIVTPASPWSEEAQGLMRQLDAELAARYPGPSYGFDPQDIDNGGVLLVARLCDQAVGCGAVRPLAPGVGEVKRMFVVKAHRDRGIAREIIRHLESAARRLRLNSLRLATGITLREALRLYESAGYTRIPSFAQYASDPFTVCYEKQLVDETTTSGI